MSPLAATVLFGWVTLWPSLFPSKISTHHVFFFFYLLCIVCDSAKPTHDVFASLEMQISDELI